MLLVIMLLVTFLVGGLAMKSMSEPGNRPLSSGSALAVGGAVLVAMLISFLRWGSGG
jgi:hypothetical protein